MHAVPKMQNTAKRKRRSTTIDLGLTKTLALTDQFGETNHSIYIYIYIQLLCLESTSFWTADSWSSDFVFSSMFWLHGKNGRNYVYKVHSFKCCSYFPLFFNGNHLRHLLWWCAYADRPIYTVEEVRHSQRTFEYI